jgi:hypothetical protein
MKKLEFIDQLKEIVKNDKKSFNNDKPALRLLFSLEVDTLHRNGDLTGSQAQNWILTDTELKQLLNIAKGA